MHHVPALLLEKKQATAKQKTSPFKLRPETLRRLEHSELLGVVGGSRVRIPLGFADDTTPIYDDTAE